MNQVTIRHWLYDLQKNAWLFNEKTIRYEAVSTTILNINSRRKKLFEMGMELHSSWVNLMLHLGLVISQKTSVSQESTSKNLNKLVVATGLSDVMNELDHDDMKRVYLQGEKHLLGYGVPQSYEKAYSRFEIAAKNGLAEASTMLGVMCEFGLGHRKDMATAFKHYTHASNLNNADAMNHLGRLYEIGKGCEVSPKTAFGLYKRASAIGHNDATTNYAYMLEHGVGCNTNKQLAVETYKIASDAGYARAQNALGSCYYRGSGVKKDYFMACMLFRRASDQGYPHAQNNLGICFEEGNGVPKDLSQAKLHYQWASEKKHPGGTCNLGYILLLERSYLDAIEKFYIAKALGSVEACFQLGMLYENGCADRFGVVLKQDLDMALRFYHEAGQQGHAKALLREASILICGPPELVNIEKAIKCLEAAAQPSLTKYKLGSLEIINEHGSKGSADAQNMLGELCEIGLDQGLEGKPNLEKALEWYRIAIKQGHNRALFNVGALYEKGQGVEKDLHKAVRFYQEVHLINPG
jgi:TPR repeat protein